LQIESAAVINRICRRLMTEHPTAPVFTIHDSVLTTANYQDDVVRTMREEVGKLGQSPGMHLEVYGTTSQEARECPRLH
jgi:hypothetical protein